jgi:pimeloyl-ACP methyl ester carboxylesterase
LLAFPSPVHEVLDWVWPPALLVLAIWTFVQARRQLHSWSRPWLIYPVTVVMALAAVGGGFETVSEALDAKAYPMAGQLIDVGGHSLHLNCTGSGGPTVVLEPGAGGMSSSLGWITPAVARNTRVCVYDRAGRGWSEPAAAPQDATQIATDLHTLLQRAHVPGPYVLAGHSFGGLYVLTYAARYPDQVAGMVLIDSTAPEPASASSQTATAHGNGSYDALGRVAALVSSSARLGLARFVDQFISGALPARSSEEVRAGTSTAADVRSIIDEYLEAGSSTREAGSLTDFGNKPLVVLTAGSGHDAAWQAKQNALAKLSTNSDHRVVAGAVHQALVDDERFAATTTQAILEDVTAVRSGGQLAH